MQCMEKGLKTLQTAGRAARRRSQRHASPSTPLGKIYTLTGSSDTSDAGASSLMSVGGAEFIPPDPSVSSSVFSGASSSSTRTGLSLAYPGARLPQDFKIGE